MADIPVLETPRLRLRAHALKDFPGCAAMWADPAVTRHIGGQPSTEPQTWARMTSYRGHWELMGFGYWALEEKETGLYVGELGFADFKRDLEPSIKGIPEAGWALVSSRHGRGYATEALRAIVSWADRHLAAARTVCIIGPAHSASIRVADKCGYRRLQDARYRGEPTILFGRDREK
ncbi:MAG: GNAT family N-acetyltransferase [Elusimicrobia bacterium]|nr:GNAT family N-acetyltransferase [Elusimicrobiota bacterium]